VSSYRGPYQVRRESLRSALSAGALSGDRLIVDAVVQRLHSDVTNPFTESQMLVVQADEGLKSLDGVGTILSWLLDSGFNRAGTLYVVGGGTVQDAASFVASILHRGVRWIFAPTTLLAQGDSCIGSKSSLNHGGYKNQLGTFYAPSEVIIDEGFLSTLTAQEVRAGLGEILHYAVLGGTDFFDAFEQGLLAGWEMMRPDQMSAHAMSAMRVKRPFVEADEFDTDVRKNLNLGHTFAHGIEFASGARISHGVAVAYGVDMAVSYSAARGLASPRVLERVQRVVRRIVDGFELSLVTPDRLIDGMAKDKKRSTDGLELVLIEDLGRPVRITVPIDARLERFVSLYVQSW